MGLDVRSMPIDVGPLEGLKVGPSVVGKTVTFSRPGAVSLPTISGVGDTVRFRDAVGVSVGAKELRDVVGATVPFISGAVGANEGAAVELVASSSIDGASVLPNSVGALVEAPSAAGDAVGSPVGDSVVGANVMFPSTNLSSTLGATVAFILAFSSKNDGAGVLSEPVSSKSTLALGAIVGAKEKSSPVSN